jgi:RNA polymerase sigma-70 factor, ECF subfamily
MAELETGLVTAGGGTSPADLERQLEHYRRELTGYCYRMLGSAFEADDAVQETMVRAWRSFDRFEGRSSMRSWLYRIATNVCLDMLRGRQRRARPMDFGPSSPGTEVPLATRAEVTWLEPIPDGKVLSDTSDPAEVAVERDTIRLAFVAALQHLPARQRAVLILREVLRWHATEVAELLDTTVVSVNSALQRARATLAASDLSEGASAEPTDDEQRALLARYIDAFERFDIESLVSLLHEDAVMSMPPFEMWVQGVDALRDFYVGPGSGCEGSRLTPITGNGLLGFAQYKSDGQGGFTPRAIHLLDMSEGRVGAINIFINPELFPLFGLPPRPE